MLNGVAVTVVTAFLQIYTETSDPRGFSIYRPQCPSGYCALGDYAQRAEKGLGEQTNHGVTLCMKVTNNSEMVSYAQGYTQIWSSEGPIRGRETHGEQDDEDTAAGSGSGSGHVETLAYWRPNVPGEDYVAVGHVATTTFDPPPKSAVCVVHKSIAIPVLPGKRLWLEHSGAASLWSATSGYAHLDLQTFFGNDMKSAPPVTNFWSLKAEVIPTPEAKLATKKIPKEHLALIYQDHGSEPLSVYAPRVPAGYAPLGHYAERAASEGNAARVMVVKEKHGTGLLIHPVKYQQIWNNQNTGANSTVAFWKPIPPPGYKCLGHMLSVGLEVPDTKSMVCLHGSVLSQGRHGAKVWWYGKSAMLRRKKLSKTVTVWRVATFSDVCKLPNTFMVTQGLNAPSAEQNLFHCLRYNGMQYKW